MKTIIKNLYGILALALTLTACYDDEGNYTYHDINEVGINIPETTVRLPRTGETTVSITPELSQTLEANEENLSFVWYKGPVTASPNIICDVPEDELENAIGNHDTHLHAFAYEKTCTLTITPDDTEPIQLMLAVTDNREGTVWYQAHVVNIVTPFSSTWFVLQDNDGKGLLGAADGDHELATIFHDVYAEEFGTTFPLQGRPVAIETRHNYGIGSWNYTMGILAPSVISALHIMTDEDLQLVIPSTLQTKYTSAQMLLGANTAQPLQLTQRHQSNWGDVVTAQGKVWHSVLDGYAVYYTVRNPEGEQLTTSMWTDYGSNFLTFDEANHRFLAFSYSSMDGMMTSYTSTKPIRDYGRAWSDAIPKTAWPPESYDYPDVFDADGPELAGITVIGMASTGTRAYAFATGGASPLTIYEFSSSWEEPTCTGVHDLTLPGDVNATDCHVLSSYAYSRILFMAAGNKVYKIDLNRSQPEPSVIYEYTGDASAKAAAVKFKDVEANNYNRHLGVAFNKADGTGVVVELHLTQAGDVDREEGSIYEYTGFGNIVDLAYNYAD